MKRYLTLLLAFVMVLAAFGMTACETEKEKPLYERYTEAMQNLEEMDQVDASLDLTMKMDVMGQSIEMPATVTIKGTGLTGDNPITRMVMTMTAMGETTTEDVYSVGGWDYYTSADGNYKMPSDEEDDENITELGEELLSEELIAKATVTEKDGITTVALALTADEFMKSFLSFAESFADGELAADGLSGTKVSLSFNKKNQLTALSLSFKMETSEDGVTMGLGMDLTMTIHKASGVTVEAPAGYENYEEITIG